MEFFIYCNLYTFVLWLDQHLYMQNIQLEIKWSLFDDTHWAVGQLDVNKHVKKKQYNAMSLETFQQACDAIVKEWKKRERVQEVSPVDL